VVEVGESAARLELSSTAATHAQFDWSFKLALRVLLTESRLRLEVRVENTGSEPMPCAFGTHPYFLVHDKAQARISTQATRAFDNVTGQVVPFKGFDLAHGETDLHLLDHGASESTLSADGHAVTVRGSPEFVRWVVWTQPGKDFVCLEPWTAPGNALNTGESLLHVAPNEAPELWLELEAS
jgi:galactose mutarotase-like enzyme